MEALNIRDDADVTPGGKLERDGDKPTGVIIANGNALGKIFDQLPKPTMEQQVDGSRKFFREMNSLGITGIVDGGGVSMYPGQLSGRVQAVARQAAHGARRLSSLRAEAGQRTRGSAEPDAVAAAGFWRPDAALQRPRRNPDLGRLDRWRHHARRQGQARRAAALGRFKGLHHPAALESGPHRA